MYMFSEFTLFICLSIVRKIISVYSNMVYCFSNWTSFGQFFYSVEFICYSPKSMHVKYCIIAPYIDY